MDNYRQKTDEFFYDNFSRAWECAVLEEMTPIYICEMDSLIYYLERKETYVQEFAKDYRLAQKLVIEVDGKLKHFKKTKSPYSIVPSKNIVLFKKYEEIVYQCSSNRVINDFCWLRKCVNIKKLDLSYTDFDDLSLLSEMKQLTELNLSGCRKLTKESFNALKYMKNLKVLNLSNTEFCNMEFLKDLNKLKSLYL